MTLKLIPHNVKIQDGAKQKQRDCKCQNKIPTGFMESAATKLKAECQAFCC